MLAALIIVFREVLEAGIVIGVVLAASQGVAQRGRWIVFGVVGGVFGSGVVALFARRIANLFDGSGQELLNAAILGIAVVMLVCTIVWMAKHGRKMAAELTAVGHDVQEGKRPLAALAIAVGMAVLREGAEVVLFLYGVVTGGGESPADIALGGVAGILLGAATSFVLYRSLVAIPLRHLFKTTGILISLLAAGLAAQSVGILQGAGFVQLMSDPLWDTEWLLPDDSPVGHILHTLIGYTAQPTGMQLTG
jgi:high-affinity iron transporter